MRIFGDFSPAIFKTYDVRGRYPRELGPGVVEAIGAALGRHFRRGRVVLAHDGRESSERLYRALVRGFRAARGVRPVRAHLATTPLFVFLVHTLGAAGGVMVTASHNPREYNGLKVVGRGGVPVGGIEILRMVKRFSPHP